MTPLHYSILYPVRFSLQLWGCEAFFVSIFPYKSRRLPRILGALTLYVLFEWGRFCVTPYLSVLTEKMPGSSSLIFNYLCSWLISYLMMHLIFDAGWQELLLAAVGGYAVQHIGYCITVIVRYYWEERLDLSLVPFYLVYYILPYLLVGIVTYWTVIRRMPTGGHFIRKNPQLLFISSITLISCLILSVFLTGDSVESQVIGRLYGALCCCLSLYIQSLYHKERALEYDRDEMERILHVERSQSKMSQEAVKIINIKCHDLKHQLSILENRTETKENREFIKEISDAMLIYNNTVKTGSDVLDMVIMQKALLCDAHGISFTYMADGERLAFLSATDTAALFGNLLDNAIEHLTKEDREKRTLSMRIHPVGEMLFISMDNTCSEEPQFREGLPVTSKADKRYHGIGMQSIDYIVQKYHGQMKIAVKDGRFYVDILFSQGTSRHR